ncbi:MAG: hypothetical protein L6R35_000864 [Caloplaca aegaea]|nr:MAG: hypothetical protein L6R35_000864 [Caloplaca aegaea]
MSSPQEASKNPFTPLQEHEADNAMEVQQASPANTAQVLTEDTRMPQTEPASSMEGVEGAGLGPIERKRVAESQLPLRPKPRGSLAEVVRMEKAAKAKAASQAASAMSVATTTATPSAQGTLPPRQGEAPPAAQDPQQTSFSLSQVPKKASKQMCALSFDKCPTIGGVTVGPNDWVTMVCFNAGRFGDPKIELEVYVRKVPTGKPLRLAETPLKELDTMRLQWIPLVKNVYGKAMVQYIDKFPLPEYTEDIEKRFLHESSVQGNLDQIWVVDTLLNLPMVEEFQDVASWDLLPADLARYLREVTTTALRHPITFFIKPKVLGVVREHVPMLRQRLFGKIGPLSQYYDPESGKLQLDSIENAKTIHDVGNGIFKLRDNVGFVKLDRVRQFYSMEQLRTFVALTPIREAQFAIGRHHYLEKYLPGCFNFKVPEFSWPTKGENLAPDSEVLDRLFFVFVRLPTDEDKQSLPEAGLRVTVEFTTGNPNPVLTEAFLSRGRKHQIGGIIVARPHAEFAATRTDFCILIQPRKEQHVPRIQTELRAIEGLPRAHVKVETVPLVQRKELSAVNTGMISRRPLLIDLRHMWMNGGRSNPRDHGDADPIDLRYGFPRDEEKRKLFDKVANVIISNMNAAQIHALQSLCHVKDHQVAISGPPGTGKTSVIAAAIWLLVFIGVKVVGCAASNKATDRLLNGIITNRHSATATLGVFHILRLEAGSVEKANLSRQMATEENPSVPATVTRLSEAEEDAKFQAAFAECCSEHADDPRMMEEFRNATETFVMNFTQAKEYLERNVKDSDIPYEHTMGGNIRRIMLEDRWQALQDYHDECQTVPEADRPAVPSADQRNRSRPYAEAYDAYMSKGGRLGRQALKDFLMLRAEMEKRVYQSVSIVITTLGNASAEDFHGLGFDPEVFVCDEAGQASLPSFCVPLASFPHLRVVILTGDWLQLTPTLLAKAANEVVENSQVSALEMTAQWEHGVVYLDVQYRMAPSIADFPQRHIYQGRLTTADRAAEDNPIRKIVRDVSLTWGVKKAGGSEYWAIDVPHGVSRVEPFGTSLQNYANVDTIDKLLRQLVYEQGMDANDICIICFYKAQTRLIMQRVVPDDDGKLFREISTADAFQGREAPVVIIDMVSAHPEAQLVAGFPPKGQEDSYHNDTGKDVVYSRLTSFVKDYHRINVALTRAKHGCIVVAQLGLLINEKVTFNRGTINNTLFCMAEDLYKRELVGTSAAIDSHPDAEKERQLREEREKDAKAHFEDNQAMYYFVRRQMLRNRGKIDAKAVEAEEEEKDVPASVDAPAAVDALTTAQIQQAPTPARANQGGQGSARGGQRGGRGGQGSARGRQEGGRGGRGSARGGQGGARGGRGAPRGGYGEGEGRGTRPEKRRPKDPKGQPEGQPTGPPRDPPSDQTGQGGRVG